MPLSSPPKTRCSLCGIENSRPALVEEDLVFCCHGCRAVYHILENQQALEKAETHPVFLQAVQAGLISNPDLLRQLQRQRVEVPEGEWKTLHLEVTDMWCPSCAEVIRLLLLQKKGIRHCVVDYTTDLASIEYAPRYLGPDEIFATIASLGYTAQRLDDPQRKPVHTLLLLRFGIAAFCSLNLMMFAYPLYASYFQDQTQGMAHTLAWLSLVVSLPVLTFCAWPIWRRFWNSLRVGLFGMETLVAIGVSAAFGLSLYELSRGSQHVYFDSMSVIITFLLLGKIIEARAKFSAKESLFRLTRALPRRGRKRFPDGSLEFVSLKDVAVDDVLVALTGETIVLDGVVLEGEGACDQSLMTGEAIPLPKEKGDELLGGSILKSGWVAYRVTHTQEEGTLHAMIQVVEQDLSHKTAYVRAADRVVRWFVPVVLLLALGTGVFYFSIGLSLHDSILRAASVLLISCPCALGIAAPLAESLLLNACAKLGAIIRNRGCLRYLGKESVFVFDKTGTLTEGQYTVQEGLQGCSPEQRRRLKALAQHSIHPVAVAVHSAIDEGVAPSEEVQEHAGKGLVGKSQGFSCLLGSRRFCEEQGVSLPPQHKSELSRVYYVENGQYQTTLLLADAVRKGVPEALQDLQGVSTLLLSGDSSDSVAAVAKACHIPRYYAEQSPLDKRQVIEDLKKQGQRVCMLGDGINDAPALTAAHLGISVVSATDLSIQVSDILLTTENLQVLQTLRMLGRKGQRVIAQNLFWAFFYNVVGVGLAMAGVLSPLFAAIAMVCSSLMVLFNARRLR